MASPAYADVVDTVTVTQRAAMKSEIRRCRHTSLRKELGDLSHGGFAMRCSMGYDFAAVRAGNSFRGSVAQAGSRTCIKSQLLPRRDAQAIFRQSEKRENAG
jgi:hypothetical protein